MSHMAFMTHMTDLDLTWLLSKMDLTWTWLEYSKMWTWTWLGQFFKRADLDLTWLDAKPSGLGLDLDLRIAGLAHHWSEDFRGI